MLLANDKTLPQQIANFAKMEKLIAYILQFGNLNQQQTDFIASKVKEIELGKDEYFSEAGIIPRQVGFVLEGVVRGCYYNNPLCGLKKSKKVAHVTENQ